MEEFAFFLLKSVIWLASFATVYFLFLKNERFFSINRMFLLSGIIAAILFPFITIRYTVFITELSNPSVDYLSVTGLNGVSVGSKKPDVGEVMFVIYLAGVLFFIIRNIKNLIVLSGVIIRSEVTMFGNAKLIRTKEFQSSFSFFSFIFINPSISQREREEILTHESVHVSQRHWIDLLLGGMLCIIQWFNPLVWIYMRIIRQNHEYMADESALKLTSDKGNYKAALLNQITGTPVFDLVNSFNYSLNKKRFDMMKEKICSPYRKVRVLLILPFFATILYSFAVPEYKYKEPEGNITNPTPGKEVKGIITKQNGQPLEGASIIIRGSNIGTLSNAKGNFSLNAVEEKSSLVVSFVGYKSQIVTPEFGKGMNIVLVNDTIEYALRDNRSHPTGNMNPHSQAGEGMDTPPPPPPVGDVAHMGGMQTPNPPHSMVDVQGVPQPPDPGISIRYGGNKKPIVVVDGNIKDLDLAVIDPESIRSVNVIKDADAAKKYGDKASDGVIEITTKNGVLNERINPASGHLEGRPPHPMVEGVPQPPVPGVSIRYVDGGNKKPTVVVDGNIKDVNLAVIDPESIKSVVVIKDADATKKYGDKANDGVIEITTKNGVLNERKSPANPDIEVVGYGNEMMVIESLPEFQAGGRQGMMNWISQNMKYPDEALKQKLEGKVNVRFQVTTDGKINNVQVVRSDNRIFNDEAKRLIGSMPDWKPGLQAGRAVDVDMAVVVDFRSPK
jgi:TonB family protein